VSWHSPELPREDLASAVPILWIAFRVGRIWPCPPSPSPCAQLAIRNHGNHSGTVLRQRVPNHSDSLGLRFSPYPCGCYLASLVIAHEAAIRGRDVQNAAYDKGWQFRLSYYVNII